MVLHATHCIYGLSFLLRALRVGLVGGRGRREEDGKKTGGVMGVDGKREGEKDKERERTEEGGVRGEGDENTRVRCVYRMW